MAHLLTSASLLYVQFVGDFKKESPACSRASAVLHDTGPKLFTQRHCCQFMGLIYRFINWIKAREILPRRLGV